MITGLDFVQLSNRWSVLPPPSGHEAVWRTAISRAYYGAFHVSRMFLVTLSIEMPKGDQKNEHVFIPMAFNNSGNDDIRLAGAKLGDLREDRNWADYRIASAGDGKKLAMQCHADAIEICNLISNCNPLDHTAIRSEIMKWREVAQK